MSHRLSAVLALTLVPLAFAPSAAHAKGKKGGDEEGAKRLSVSFSAGIRPDMAQLGSTIAQDGTIDVAATSFANRVYSTDKLFMSDRNNMTLDANSKQTDSVFNVQNGYAAGGSMLGAEWGGDVRYELDDAINFPMFIEAGFYYTGKISGGEQSRTFGDVANQSETIGTLAALYGLDTNDYSGGTMKTTWDASWWEIPVSLGFKVPVKPHLYGYGWVGVSWFNGGFSIDADVDETYARILATHIDESTTIPTITDLSPGAVKESIEFKTAAMGLNYGLGVQANIKKTFAVFIELESSGAAKTVYATKVGEGSRALLTAVSSQTLAENDATWFKDVAYPVVMQGASGQVGFRAYLF
jgi:hypothetical protein